MQATFQCATYFYLFA